MVHKEIQQFAFIRSTLLLYIWEAVTRIYPKHA